MEKGTLIPDAGSGSRGGLAAPGRQPAPRKHKPSCRIVSSGSRGPSPVTEKEDGDNEAGTEPEGGDITARSPAVAEAQTNAATHSGACRVGQTRD